MNAGKDLIIKCFGILTLRELLIEVMTIAVLVF